MPSEQKRILELALESLENKKKQIDAEIAELSKELGRGRRGRPPSVAAPKVVKAKRGRKRSSFSKEERMRRAERMKAYWAKWRKDKAKQK